MPTALRTSPRTRPIAVLVAILALVATGCGGGEVAADEVPGAPPALTVTSDTELQASGADSGDTGDAAAEDGASTDSNTTEAAPPADAGTTDSGTTTTPPADDSGGATVPEATAAPEDSAATDQAPDAGTPPDQFEDFCEQNAGAC